MSQETVDTDIDLRLPASYSELDIQEPEALIEVINELKEAIYILASVVAASRSDANQAQLTNNTGGTYNGVLAAISGSGADSGINNNFTELFTQVDAIRSALIDSKIIQGS